MNRPYCGNLRLHRETDKPEKIKPRVSVYVSRYPKILKLEPDLVLTFSDLQAYRGGPDQRRHRGAVHAFNNSARSRALDMIRTLGAVGASKAVRSLRRTT